MNGRRLYGALLCVSLAACAPVKKSYVVLLEDPQGGVGAITVRSASGTQTVDQARFAASLDGSGEPALVDPKQFDADFADVLAARPVLPQTYLLYFESGGAELTAESRALLPRILTDTQSRAAADVSIIGHTDTVGNAPANEALALQRAQWVADQLAQAGLKPFAQTVASHGESSLLVPTPDDTPEPRNRRVEVTVR